MSSINDYLPEKPNNVSLVQAKVPKELRKKVKSLLKKRGLTWNDLIVAAMKQLLAEESR